MLVVDCWWLVDGPWCLVVVGGHWSWSLVVGDKSMNGAWWLVIDGQRWVGGHRIFVFGCYLLVGGWHLSRSFSTINPAFLPLHLIAKHTRRHDADEKS